VAKIQIGCSSKLHQLSVKLQGKVLLIEGSFDLGEESRIIADNLKEILTKTL